MYKNVFLWFVYTRGKQFNVYVIKMKAITNAEVQPLRLYFMVLFVFHLPYIQCTASETDVVINVSRRGRQMPASTSAPSIHPSICPAHISFLRLFA